MTQTLREQQDQAYIESLRADEEKQRQREEKKAKLRAEELRQQSEAKAEQNRRISIEILKQQTVQNLPPEPSANDLNSVHIVFKLPNGSRISRRFYNSDSLQVCFLEDNVSKTEGPKSKRTCFWRFLEHRPVTFLKTEDTSFPEIRNL